MRKILFVLISVAGFSACKMRSEKKIDFKYDTIRLDSKFEFTKDDVYIPAGRTNIEYPKFTDTAVNKFILNKVVSFMDQKKADTSFADIAESFLQRYDDFANANKQRVSSPWNLTMTLKVITANPNYLSIKYTYNDFVGGAHGNTSIRYINYDPITNSEVKLNSLIQDEKMNAFQNLAEVIFRKQEKLQPNDSLAEKYFFENGKFKLPNNFYVSAKGINFLYNPYEIKPWVDGFTELIIPFESIKDMVKENTVFKIKP